MWKYVGLWTDCVPCQLYYPATYGPNAMAAAVVFYMISPGPTLARRSSMQLHGALSS